MEINIFWFNLAKDFFALFLCGLTVWLIYSYSKKSGRRDDGGLNITPKGVTIRAIPMIIAVIIAAYNPVRLGVQDGAEEKIQRNYDSRPSTEEIVIDRHSVEEYNPPSNEDEIKSITKED